MLSGPDDDLPGPGPAPEGSPLHRQLRAEYDKLASAPLPEQSLAERRYRDEAGWQIHRSSQWLLVHQGPDGEVGLMASYPTGHSSLGSLLGMAMAQCVESMVERAVAEALADDPPDPDGPTED